MPFFFLTSTALRAFQSLFRRLEGGLFQVSGDFALDAHSGSILQRLTTSVAGTAHDDTQSPPRLSVQYQS